METIIRLVGVASEPSIAERLHDLEHLGRVEILTVDRDDTLRRRLRGKTNKGTEVIIALDRTEQLTDGAVLVLEDERAIVARMTDERWLRISPRDLDAAMETGYFVGNLHWRIRFEPGALLVALEGPVERYTSRLVHLTMQGRIRISGHD